MRKIFRFTAIAILCAAFVFPSVGRPAQAADYNQTWALLQSLQAQLAAIQAQLKAQTGTSQPVTPPTPPPIPALPYPTGSGYSAPGFITLDELPNNPQVSCVLTEMRTGLHSDSVYLLQMILKEAGYYPEGLITGYYGKLTGVAVQRFQSANGFVASGWLDMPAAAALNAVVKKYHPTECGGVVISSSSSISFTFPTSGASLEIGRAYTVTWTGADSGLENYSVYLIGGPSGMTIYAGDVPSWKNSYSLTIPPVLTGSGYRVQFKNAVNGTSPSFTIVSGPSNPSTSTITLASIQQNVSVVGVTPISATQASTAAGQTIGVFKVTNGNSFPIALTEISFSNGGVASPSMTFGLYSSVAGGSQTDSSVAYQTGQYQGGSGILFFTGITNVSESNRTIPGGSWRYLTIKTTAAANHNDTFQLSVSAPGMLKFLVRESDAGISLNPESDNDLTDSFTLSVSGYPSLATVTAKSDSVQPSITVLSPNGGENWNTSETHLIQWTSSNPANQSLVIDLVKPADTMAGGWFATVVAPIGNGFFSGNQFSWTVPTSIPSGGNYMVRVMRTGGDVGDMSNSQFSIAATTTPATPASPVLTGANITAVESTTMTTGGSVYVVPVRTRDGNDFYVTESAQRADVLSLLDQAAQSIRALIGTGRSVVAKAPVYRGNQDPIYTMAGAKVGWWDWLDNLTIDGVKIYSTSTSAGQCEHAAPPAGCQWQGPEIFPSCQAQLVCSGQSANPQSPYTASISGSATTQLSDMKLLLQLLLKQL